MKIMTSWTHLKEIWNRSQYVPNESWREKFPMERTTQRKVILKLTGTTKTGVLYSGSGGSLKFLNTFFLKSNSRYFYYYYYYYYSKNLSRYFPLTHQVDEKKIWNFELPKFNVTLLFFSFLLFECIAFISFKISFKEIKWRVTFLS